MLITLVAFRLGLSVVFGVGGVFVLWQGRLAIQASTLLLSDKLGERQYLPLVVFVAMAILVTTVIYFQRARAKSNAGSHNHPSPELQGLPLGTDAPAFQLPAYRRVSTSLAELLEPGKPVLLIFSNPNCGPCAALFGELAQWQRTYPEQVTMAVLTQGTLK